MGLRMASDVHVLIAPWVMRIESFVRNGALVDAHVHEPLVAHAVLGGLVEREDCGGSTTPTNLRIVCAGALFDTHVREPLAALAVLGGVVEREDRIISLARRWALRRWALRRWALRRRWATLPQKPSHPLPSKAKARILNAAVRLIIQRHVEERREEKEDTDADGHDSGGELAAGVDGRAAWRTERAASERIRGDVGTCGASFGWMLLL